jgi:hypothetical protein
MYAKVYIYYTDNISKVYRIVYTTYETKLKTIGKVRLLMNNIVFRIAGGIIALSERDVYELLKARPELWQKGLKQGKGQLRYDVSMNRVGMNK